MKLREKRLEDRKEISAPDVEVIQIKTILTIMYYSTLEYCPGCHFTEYMDPYHNRLTQNYEEFKGSSWK